MNTVLRIKARTNIADNVNSGVDTLTTVLGVNLNFKDQTNLDSSILRQIRESLESSNEEPIIGDIANFSTNELRIRALNSTSAQNRAVSREDYRTLVYMMPSEYGAVKRVNVVKDNNSFKRNINIYLISEGPDR